MSQEIVELDKNVVNKDPDMKSTKSKSIAIKKTKKPTKKERKLIIKILKAPLWILLKARDLYVKSMIECSGQIYTSSMGLPAESFPRSFSVNSTRSFRSTEEDSREILRLASIRSLKINLDNLNNKQQMNISTNKLSRSQTAAIGRIDEGNESEFSGNLSDQCPRSKSDAAVVTKKTIENDFLKPYGLELLKHCVDPVIIHHPKGHTIPRLIDEKWVDSMLNFLDKIQKDVAEEKESLIDHLQKL